MASSGKQLRRVVAERAGAERRVPSSPPPQTHPLLGRANGKSTPANNQLSHCLRSPFPGPTAPGGAQRRPTEVGQSVSTNLWRGGVSRRALSAPARLLGSDANPGRCTGAGCHPSCRLPPHVLLFPPQFSFSCKFFKAWFPHALYPPSVLSRDLWSPRVRGSLLCPPQHGSPTCHPRGSCFRRGWLRVCGLSQFPQ